MPWCECLHVCIIMGACMCHVCACTYVCVIVGALCTIVWVLTYMYVLLRGTYVCHSVSVCMHVCVIVGRAYVCHSTYIEVRGQPCGICSFMGSMDWVPGFEASSLYPLSHLDASNLLLF